MRMRDCCGDRHIRPRKPECRANKASYIKGGSFVPSTNIRELGHEYTTKVSLGTVRVVFIAALFV